MDGLRNGIRILRQYMLIGIVRKSQFRLEFFAQVVMDCVWYSVHIFIFEILYLHTESIAGWSHNDIRVLLGFLFISDAFMMTFLGSNWHFGRDLKDGKLDPFRVRPASAILLYFFQLFSLEGAFNFAFASTYLLYATNAVTSLSAPATWGFLVWGALLGFWVRTVLCVLFSIPEFYFLNSDLGRFLQSLFGATADRPLDIFARRFRLFLIYGIPVGSLAFVPAALLLGKLTVTEGIGISAWALLLGKLVFMFWQRSFRRYESALG